MTVDRVVQGPRGITTLDHWYKISLLVLPFYWWESVSVFGCGGERNLTGTIRDLEVVLPFLWWELTGDCWWKKFRGSVPLRILSKPSAFNGFWFLPLPTTVWVGLVILFPSVWWVVEEFVWTWKPNVPLPLCRFTGVRLNFGSSARDYNLGRDLLEDLL
jgi:hypothetical protein